MHRTCHPRSTPTKHSQLLCWFHRFVINWLKHGARVKVQCSFVFTAVEEWFYRLRRQETGWLFDVEMACLQDMVARAETAQLITADAAVAATSFIAASDSMRGAWAASAQSSRSMTLNDYTSNGAEVEFLVWKKTSRLTRATSLQELYHGGRSLFAIRHEADAAADSGAQQFKKSCMLLGTQPAPVKLAFSVCTPRVAKQLLRQYELAEMMTSTVVSDTEVDVQWNDGQSDHADEDLVSERPWRKVRTGTTEDNKVMSALASVASEHFQPGEGKCGLRFGREPGADANHPWRFYGVHRLEQRYGGKVVLIGGRLCCRASAGGSPCAFAREFGPFLFFFASPPRPLTSARMPVSTLKACAMCVQAWRASVHSSECAFAIASVCPVCPLTFPSLRRSLPFFLRPVFCRSPVQRHDRSKQHVLLRS